MKKLMLLFFVFDFDVISKVLVNVYDPNFAVFGDVLRITHVKNTGIAFGVPLPGIEWLIPVILVCIGIFLWKSWNRISESEKIGFLLIITGGLLNALERMFFGSVTDFISVQNFSVFNVADISITAGVIVLLAENFWGKEKESKE